MPESLRKAPQTLVRPTKLESEQSASSAFAPIPTTAPKNRGLSAAQALVDLAGVAADQTNNVLKEKIAEDVTRQRQRALEGMEPENDATKSGKLAFDTVHMRNDFAIMQKELAKESQAQEWTPEDWNDNVVAKQSAILKKYDNPGDTRMAEMMTNMMGEALPSIQVKRWDDRQAQDVAKKQAVTTQSIDIAADTAKTPQELKAFMVNVKTEAKAMGLPEDFTRKTIDDAAIARAEQDDLSLMNILDKKAFDHNPALAKAQRAAEGRLLGQDAVRVSSEMQGLTDQFTGYGGLSRISEGEFRRQAEASNQANPPGVWTAAKINSTIEKRRNADEVLANKKVGKPDFDVEAMIAQGGAKYNNPNSVPMSEYVDANGDRPSQKQIDKGLDIIEQGFLFKNMREAGLDVNDQESLKSPMMRDIIFKTNAETADFMSINNVVSTTWKKRYSSVANIPAENYGADDSGKLPESVMFQVEQWNALSEGSKIAIVPNVTERAILSNVDYYASQGKTEVEALKLSQKAQLYAQGQSPMAKAQETKAIMDGVDDEFNNGFFMSMFFDTIENPVQRDFLAVDIQRSVLADRAAGNRTPTEKLVQQHIADFTSNNTGLGDGSWVNVSKGKLKQVMEVHDPKEAVDILTNSKALLVGDLIVDGDLPDRVGTIDEVSFRFDPLSGGFNLVGVDGTPLLDTPIPMATLKRLDMERKAKVKTNAKPEMDGTGYNAL